MDTWDMKSDAPSEYRDTFKVIEITVPGIRICKDAPMGAADSVLIVVPGEFGRKPKIDQHAGQDHWFQGVRAMAPDAGLNTG